MRHIYTPEIEVIERSGDSYISGYAAVFDEDFHLFADAYERFSKRAFNDIANQVIECWYDHDSKMILGTTSVERSLKIAVDENGLRYEQRYNPQDADHVYVRSKIASGLVRGSSLGFKPTKQRWIQEDGKHINLIESCTVRDVGPTPKPCYGTTSATVRSESDLSDLKNRYETWRRLQKLELLSI